MWNNIFSNVYITTPPPKKNPSYFSGGYCIIWALDMKLKSVCLLRINLMYNWKEGKSFL